VCKTTEKLGNQLYGKASVIPGQEKMAAGSWS